MPAVGYGGEKMNENMERRKKIGKKQHREGGDTYWN